MNINQIQQFLDSYLNKAYPGYVCAICKKNGEIYKLKGGYTSYEKNKEKITYDTYFDLASLTKVIGTTMLACRYIDKGLLRLDDTIGMYFESENYKDVTIQNLMTHTGGFITEIRLENYLDSPNQALDFILKQNPNYKANTQVKYSCMGYIVLGKILEKIGNNNLDILCKEEVFKPLKMNHITYNPRKTKQFAATEIPKNKTTPLRGVVHDENARFLNGISGNAGLFSPIEDLIKFTQILLNEDTSFLSKEMYYKLSHNLTKDLNLPRALGFNLYNDIDGKFFGNKVSNKAYGHTGFTGTSIIIDPIKEIGVILLTNRVCPTRNNKLLLCQREKFHNLIFN